MVSPDRLCGGGLDKFKHPGPSVEDLATALADLPGFRATAPAPVRSAGTTASTWSWSSTLPDALCSGSPA